MSFGHKLEDSGSISESEAEKIQKHKLTQLGNEVAQALATKQSLDNVEEDILKAKDLLASINGEVDDRSASLVALKNAQIKLQQDFDVLQNFVVATRAEHDAIGKEADDLTKIHFKLSQEILTLKKQHTALKEDIASLIQEREKHVADTAAAQTDHENVIAGHTEQLKQATEVIAGHTQTISDLQIQLEGLQKEVTDKTAQLSDLNDNIQKQNDALAGLKVIYDQKQIGVEKQLSETQTKKETEWSQREGDLNLRENWLNEKTEKLKLIKSELEKFYNRKINTVIF